MKKQPYLGSPVHTAAVLRSHGITARKKYGQNFLVDADVLEETVRAAGLTESDGVLEIGPGIGTLTQYLAFSAGKVVAVEIDRTLLPVLEDTLMGWNNVEVVNGDILKMDLEALVRDRYEGRPVKVVDLSADTVLSLEEVLGRFEDGAVFFTEQVAVDNLEFSEAVEEMTTEPATAEDLVPTAAAPEPPRVTGRKMTERKISDLGKLRSLRAAGWDVEKIATEFGCSGQTVRNTMKREGIE